MMAQASVSSPCLSVGGSWRPAGGGRSMEGLRSSSPRELVNEWERKCTVRRTPALQSFAASPAAASWGSQSGARGDTCEERVEANRGDEEELRSGGRTPASEEVLLPMTVPRGFSSASAASAPAASAGAAVGVWRTKELRLASDVRLPMTVLDLLFASGETARGASPHEELLAALTRGPACGLVHAASTTGAGPSPGAGVGRPMAPAVRTAAFLAVATSRTIHTRMLLSAEMLTRPEEKEVRATRESLLDPSSSTGSLLSTSQRMIVEPAAVQT
mmetsp:Transcript_9284/g.38147  ORF Transcript_9284/g.38147 Transcript_9284/m.38147 type:complete len:274 (+) Transcript_9284:36-857(+)